MIAVRPGSDAWRVLDLLVLDPGGYDAEALALALHPPPKLTGPVASGVAYALWRAARVEHVRTWSSRMSRLLGRLTEAGYIEPAGAPRLSPTFAQARSRRGIAEALVRAHPDWPGKVPDLGGHVRMVGEVEKGPASVAALLGGRPSGARKRTYRDLVEWGVVVSATRREATARGIAVVRGVAA